MHKNFVYLNLCIWQGQITAFVNPALYYCYVVCIPESSNKELSLF